MADSIITQAEADALFAMEKSPHRHTRMGLSVRWRWDFGSVGFD